MNLENLRIFIFIFLVITSACLGEIVMKTPESERSSYLVTEMTQIIKSCYEKGSSIGMAGEPPSGLLASLSVDGNLATVLIKDSHRFENNTPASRILRHKLEIFIVTASSSLEFERLLIELKTTLWWNHMAHFYILESSLGKLGCPMAHEILLKAWKINILNAQFFCNNQTTPTMYTFNPYARVAPTPWKLEKTYESVNDHPWSLFVQKFHKKSEICAALNFEKTKNLDGYEIRANTLEDIWDFYIDRNKTGVDSMQGVHGELARDIFRVLNASVKLTVQGLEKDMGWFDDMGNVHGVLAETVRGVTDISFVPRNYVIVRTLPMLYPFYQGGLGIITRYRGHLSQLEKIISLYDAPSKIAMFLIILTVPIFLKLMAHQSAFKIFSNTLRFICFSSLTGLPIDLGPRIYLTFLLLYAVTMQGIFQGQLPALLAKRQALKNVETINDLAESEHMIYVVPSLFPLFDDPRFNGRKFVAENSNCIEDLLRDTSNACVWRYSTVVVAAAEMDFHVSRNVVKIYSTWVVRDDWPLERKFNKISRSLVEANLFEYLGDKYVEKPLRIIKAREDKYKDLTFKILTLHDLTFAFAILGLGLTSATLSFLFEIVTSNITKTNVNKNIAK